jgi:hypothetical protein
LVSETPKLAYLEIAAIIQAFVGTVLIDAVSTSLLQSPILYYIFLAALEIFFLNLLVIYKAYDFDGRKFRYLTTTAIQFRPCALIKRKIYLFQIAYALTTVTIFLLIILKVGTV